MWAADDHLLNYHLYLPSLPHLNLTPNFPRTPMKSPDGGACKMKASFLLKVYCNRQVFLYGSNNVFVWIVG